MGELTKIKAEDLRQSVHYNRTNCFICGENKFITEWHHVITLKKCAEELNNGADNLENELICLCPNCHSYSHKLLYSESLSEEQYMLLSQWGDSFEKREKIISLKQKIWI